MTKRQQIITYLAKKHDEASKTVLMKLCYLLDIVSIKRNGQQITDFEYIRYKFGPFNEEIYKDIKHLTQEGIFTEESKFTLSGNEVNFYSVNNSIELPFDNVSADELAIIDEVLEASTGYGARALTEICYNTKPMKALKATLGGIEGLNKVLDLNLVR